MIGAQNKIKTTKEEEYDKNPYLVLSEIKNLIEDIKLGGNQANVINHSIPAFCCARLLIEHKGKLSQQDKAFCKEVVIETASNLFSDNYDYQISDGVEASFHAIPVLINEYPEEVNDYILMMVLSLLDNQPIGNYKRICDYAIEAIRKSNMWEENPDVTQSILFGYIKVYPIYKKIVSEIRKKNNWGRVLKSSVLKNLTTIFSEVSFQSITFDINDVVFLDIPALEVVLQLIPPSTKNAIHLEIYTKSLPLLAQHLMMDGGMQSEKSLEGANIYVLRQHIFQSFSYFILQRNQSEIDAFLLPFINTFACTEETASFLAEIVSAEDKLHMYDQFWHIWNSLYPKIKELCANSRAYHLTDIVINYLFAWRWWREGVEEWRSLKKENISIYRNAAKDIGHIPAVLYSIVKVLNSIGAHFNDEGIDWIHIIVSNNKSLQLGELSGNTLYYLEFFLRKFVFLNKQKIKEELKLKNKVIPILDFMIERGSIHGYLLRESIL